MMKKVRVIMHGRHEQSEKWRKDWQEWREIAPYSLSIVYTHYPGHANELAFKAVQQEVDVLVAAGGDGTINECVNGYLKANGQIPITFLAKGTGNDFVKSLLQSGQWREVHQMIEINKVDQVDVGWLEFIELSGAQSQRYFINVMDIGLGGEVVQKISKSKRRLGPFLTYQKAVISSLMEYKRNVVKVELDNVSFENDTLMLAIANAKWFGSGLGIAPMASLQDGIFEVIHIGEITLFDYLLQLPKVRRGEILQHPSIRYYSSKAIAISTPGIPIDCDGEFIGFTPLDCRIVHNRLNVLVH